MGLSTGSPEPEVVYTALAHFGLQSLCGDKILGIRDRFRFLCSALIEERIRGVRPSYFLAAASANACFYDCAPAPQATRHPGAKV